MTASDLDRALIQACRDGDVDLVEKLIDQGARVNGTMDGIPFIVAARNGHVHVLECLRRRGAYSFARDNTGKAFHHAVLGGHIDVVRYLFTNKLDADPNLPDVMGITPLAIASRRGDIAMVDFLVSIGAKFSMTGPIGWHAILAAASSGQIEMLRHLITRYGLDPDTASADGTTAFMIAATLGDELMLDTLIELDANPFLSDNDGQSALHRVARYGKPHIARLLVERYHLNPNAQNKQGHTPFVLSVENDDITMIDTLFELGADPYISNHYGHNAIQYAILHRRTNAVQHLIHRYSFDLDAQNRKGRTAFMIAAANGYLDILKMLADNGANPHVLDKKGRSALFYAIQNKNSRIVHHLVNSCLLDVNIQDVDGITPLMLASQINDCESVDVLIRRGADISLCDRLGRNALHHAVEQQSDGVVSRLLRAGVNPNQQDHNGNTPLMIAITKRNRRLVTAILQGGGDPYIRNHEGKDAFAIAKECGVEFDLLQLKQQATSR